MGTSGYQFLDGSNLFAVIELLKGDELQPYVFDESLSFGAFQLKKQFLLKNVRQEILFMKLDTYG